MTYTPSSHNIKTTDTDNIDCHGSFCVMFWYRGSVSCVVFLDFHALLCSLVLSVSPVYSPCCSLSPSVCQCFLLWASPLVTSPGLLCPLSPHLFPVLSLVSVCIVFVFPLVFVFSLLLSASAPASLVFLPFLLVYLQSSICLQFGMFLDFDSWWHLLFPSPAPVYLCVWTCGHGSSVRSSGEVHLQIIPLIIPWYITPVSSPLRCQIVPPVMVTISRASNHCVPPQTLWILINSVAPQPLPPLLLHLGPDTKTWQNKKYDKEWLVGQSLNQSILIVYGLISSQKPDFCQGKTKITQKPLEGFAAGKILKCFVLLFFSAFCHLLLSLHLNELKVLVLPRARCVDYPATCKSFLVHHRSSQTKEGSIQLLCQNVEVGGKKIPAQVASWAVTSHERLEGWNHWF